LLLDTYHGAACLLGPDGRIQAASASWSDIVDRVPLPDTVGEIRVGGMLADVFSDDERRGAFAEALDRMLQPDGGAVTQTAELGTANSPLTLEFVIHPLREGSALTGCLVQVMDVTHEQVMRAALLERERRLREMRTAVERRNTEMNALRDQNDRSTVAHDGALRTLLSAMNGGSAQIVSDLCRWCCETSGAHFVTAARWRQDEQRFVAAAHYQAPEQLQGDQSFAESLCAPARQAINDGCAVKFNHLTEREDVGAWRQLAADTECGTLWVFPVADDNGEWGVIQLHFEADDVAIPVEVYALINWTLRLSAGLLRAIENYEKPAPTVEPPVASQPVALPAEPIPDNLRVLAAGLADEFSNLLTGVLGHSSLVAAEMGGSHPAADDVRAIERAARNAAHATRRLSALCGSARRPTVALELSSFLRNYSGRDRADFFPHGPAEISALDGPCPLFVDAGSLEVILDGMSDHARSASVGEKSPTWALVGEDGAVRLSLTYEGLPSLPSGWNDPIAAHHSRTPLPELLYAREAARALGGNVAILEHAESTELMLTLPAALHQAGGDDFKTS